MEDDILRKRREKDQRRKKNQRRQQNFQKKRSHYSGEVSNSPIILRKFSEIKIVIREVRVIRIKMKTQRNYYEPHY